MAVVTLGRFRAIAEESIAALQDVVRASEQQARAGRQVIAKLESLVREIDILSARIRDTWGLDAGGLDAGGLDAGGLDAGGLDDDGAAGAKAPPKA